MASTYRHAGKEGPFFALQSIDILDEVRIGEQRVEGEEEEVQRDHRGCEQTHGGETQRYCSTSPGNPRETFPRDLRDFRMLYINSFSTSIFRAAMINEYLVFIQHFWNLQYFIVEYWWSY